MRTQVVATPTVVRSNGLAPALSALHGRQAKQSPDRRAKPLPAPIADRQRWLIFFDQLTIWGERGGSAWPAIWALPIWWPPAEFHRDYSSGCEVRALPLRL